MPNEKSTNYTPLIWIAGLYFLSDKLFGDDKEGKEDKKATEDLEKEKLRDNPFEPGFKPKGKLPAGMTFVTLKGYDGWKKLLKSLNGAIGYVWDNEAKILSGLKKARTRSDLWLIARMYDREYSEDLYFTFKQNLSKKELGKVNKYVNKLPEYVEK